MPASKQDILIFLSDQHDGRCMSWMGDTVIETPYMDHLAAEGTAFRNAYTACPLCVPSRMSMLTGQLPSHTGVFTNHGSIHPEMPTFLHSLAVNGYETVLCGRMHFEGEDQRHGFTRRIADDITATAINSDNDFFKRFAPGATLMTDAGCLQAIGGGNSLTLEYDRYVVNQALNYLKQPHQAPQCIVVGTYGPHYPFIAPPELYRKYSQRTSLPPNLHCPPSSYTADKLHDDREDLVLAVRAAYAGMVEFEDQCLGQIYSAWKTFLESDSRTGIFIYLSDHGEQAGEHGLYGKQTLYEPSVRVPMIFSGSGIAKGKIEDTPVSLLDVAPTLCELTGSQTLPACDGESLKMYLEQTVSTQHQPVIAEWIDAPYRFGTHYGRMIRKNKWKLVCFPDYPEEDLLTIPDQDYWEMNNLISQYPDIADALRQEAFENIAPDEIVRKKNQHSKELLLMEQFGAVQRMENVETWSGTNASQTLPEHYIHTDKPLPEKFKPFWNKSVLRTPRESIV